VGGVVGGGSGVGGGGSAGTAVGIADGCGATDAGRSSTVGFSDNAAQLAATSTKTSNKPSWRMGVARQPKSWRESMPVTVTR